MTAIDAEKQMTNEASKALIRRYIEERYNTANAAVVDELVAEHFVDRSTAEPLDRESLSQATNEFLADFPDAHVEIEDIVADGDKVAYRYRTRATHRGEFQGIPPTGLPIEVVGFVIDRIEDGRIAERWEGFDALGFLTQLGFEPNLPTAD